ncbi:MAG: OmpH family outer membrane protein [Cytophagales bacterium]|nr:MAG: OmpH family outer membrane protein [Cytophagales bacterium]
MHYKYYSCYLFLFILFLPTKTQAQKIGYIDADYVLKQMPDYQKVQSEIDKAVQIWQKDVDAKLKSVDDLKKKYLQEEILLTDEMKQERLADIEKKEQEAREYQRQIFGYQGQLFNKQNELMKPVQEQLYKAVAKVSRQKKIQIMFDKSADLIMIYHEPRHDYTEDVLRELGLLKEDNTNNNGNN